MVLKQVKSSDLKDMTTCQRIRETALNLFALKGFNGVSIREIARIACVNVAAVNYHFKSKENLRDEVMEQVFTDFRSKVAAIGKVDSAAKFAVKMYELMIEDQALCLNQFKLILDTDAGHLDKDDQPMGFEQFSVYLESELHKNVPKTERLWLMHVMLTYIFNTAVMTATKLGKRSITQYFQTGISAIPESIEKLVNGLIRDLNARYPQR